MPLDHGIINIPGRTSGVNAELDRYKAQQQKDKRAAEKAASTQHRADQAAAKALIAGWDDAQCVRYAARLTGIRSLTPKQTRTKLNRVAHWTPRSILMPVSSINQAPHDGAF